ncbi:hypothetical protein D9M71_809720 [compost metagenome]
MVKMNAVARRAACSLEHPKVAVIGRVNTLMEFRVAPKRMHSTSANPSTRARP